jgi:hypothetical protein
MMSRLLPAMAVVLILSTAAQAQFTYIEDPAKGTLTIRDGKVEVLTYCYGDRLKAGVDPNYTQSSYIHPLFSLDGQALTDDSPADHLHHHGLFWTWPVVKVRGLNTSTWEPKLPRLRQFFVRWLKREAANGSFLLSVENAWKLDGKETVAKEKIVLEIHPIENTGRLIDLELTIEASGGSLELQGTLDQNKGYGGLCFRGAPMFTGAALITDKGALNEDVVHTPFRWADISTRELGVSIFVSPDHPGFPTKWLIRNSYAGLINVSWPGLTSVVLKPGEPVTLRYRVIIHRGNAAAADVEAAYRQFLGEGPSNNPLSSILPRRGGGLDFETDDHNPSPDDGKSFCRSDRSCACEGAYILRLARGLFLGLEENRLVYWLIFKGRQL